MQIESIEIRNYRLFRRAAISGLPRLVVVVGANGSGKSTLFDVFSFLKDALAHNVSVAVTKRGGFRELVSRGEKGPVGITVKFRETGGRLATYRLDVADNAGRPVVDREILRYRRDSSGKPWHFVDFSKGEGTAITNEAAMQGKGDVKEERATYVLEDPSALAIKGLGQFREFRVVSEFRSLIENWHISNFHISDARPAAEDGYAEHLSTLGENIAPFAKYLHENHPETFEKVLQAMQRRVPGVGKIEAKPTEDGRLVLRFQDGSFRDPFIARYVSDGTIKMFAYLLLLNDPKPFPLLAVEEPENQLYPELLPELTEEFRGYAQRGGQVFVSTHSPDFLNGTTVKEVYYLVKRNGFSEIKRAADNELIKGLVAEGDQMGTLLRQGLLKGVVA